MKNQFLHYLFEKINHTILPSFWRATTQTIVFLSLARDLFWKEHISQLSRKLGVLRHIQNFYTPLKLPTLQSGIVYSWKNNSLHICFGSICTVFLKTMELKIMTFRFKSSFTPATFSNFSLSSKCSYKLTNFLW